MYKTATAEMAEAKVEGGEGGGGDGGDNSSSRGGGGKRGTILDPMDQHFVGSCESHTHATA